MKGGINLQMLTLDTHELHCVCLNLPFGDETVQGVEEISQFSHFTSDGEGAVIHWRPWAAINDWLWFEGRQRKNGVSGVVRV